MGLEFKQTGRLTKRLVSIDWRQKGFLTAGGNYIKLRKGFSHSKVGGMFQKPNEAFVEVDKPSQWPTNNRDSLCQHTFSDERCSFVSL